MRKPVLILLVCLVLAGCGQVIDGRSATAKSPAARGTGDELGLGVEVVDSIPGGLPVSGAPRIDHGDVCGSIPAAALAELGYGEPHDRWSVFCQWLDKRDGHHFVNVGYDERPLAAAVKQISPGLLSHLRWLRLDGHYAVEQVLDYDPMQSCSVIAEYGASETLLVTTYTGLETSTEDAVSQLCAKSRQVARAVLGHLGR
jgi:Protein of unknown function (DUF3558)